MEELFEFMKEAREMDRKIELEYAIEKSWKESWKEGWKEGWEEGRQEGLKKAFIHIITNYIKNCKEKPAAARLAAIFEVEQFLVEPFLSTRGYK
jgi:flagellar biosynthesis/type III secretory pathway protein FliH